MTDDHPTAPADDTLERVPWRLERGIALSTGVSITARFAGGTLSGSIAGVPYRAEYDWEPQSGRLRIAAVPPGIEADALERDYVRLLGAVGAAVLHPTGSLTLRDARGDEVLRFGVTAAVGDGLVGRWSVIGVRRGAEIIAPMSGGSPHLWFDPSGHLTGSVGVNRIRGQSRTDGDAVHLGPLTTTRMAGDPDAMEEEADLLDALDRVARSRRDGDRLSLLDADGEALVDLRVAPESPLAHDPLPAGPE